MNEDLARKNTKHLISAQTLTGKTKDKKGKGFNHSIFLLEVWSTAQGLGYSCVYSVLLKLECLRPSFVNIYQSLRGYFARIF